MKPFARHHACDHCVIGEKNIKIYLSGPVIYRDVRETGPRAENQQQTQPTYDAETERAYLWRVLFIDKLSFQFCNFSGQQIQ